MAQNLSGGNSVLALLANTLATGAALIALILTFGSISGAHFNPVVTLADALEGGIPWRETPVYLGAQLFGGHHRNPCRARDVPTAFDLHVPAHSQWAIADIQ
jgi:glycerol uptake facilitator-like aquaporin